MVKPTHQWIVPRISEVKLKSHPEPIHYEDVKKILADLKALMKKERNYEAREKLAKAGIELSNILLK